VRAIASVVFVCLTSSSVCAYNGANAWLMAAPPAQRIMKLGRVVGDGCVGKRAFYMGLGTTDISRNRAFWSIQCADRRSYAVQVNPDGTSKVLECWALRALHAGECFRSFPKR